MEKTLKRLKLCAAHLSEASQGLSVSTVGGISTFSAVCGASPLPPALSLGKLDFP